MNKYKTCVYAICKNEEKFVKRWYESIKDSDYICVLDTGSTDNTVKILKELGVNVKIKKIDPWRFDNARNESMKLIPKDTDICICLDLDELMAPDWKNILNEVWDDKTTRLSYIYNWSLDEYDNPLITFYADKIHAYNCYKWTHPVHEVLTLLELKLENRKYTDKLIINHYPDSSKSRSSYLPLLELSVKEDPLDDRNMHYLGREYMFYGKWNKAIDTLIKHLNLDKATWKDERCASMRFISRCYLQLKRYDEAKMWLNKAIKEAPHLRDPYAEMAILMYHFNDWDSVIKYCKDALKIKYNPKTYINEYISYNETLYDLLSIAYYYKSDIKNAIKYATLALKINPKNIRIKNNIEFYKKNI